MHDGVLDVREVMEYKIKFRYGGPTPLTFLAQIDDNRIERSVSRRNK